jgi:cell division protein FtsW
VVVAGAPYRLLAGSAGVLAAAAALMIYQESFRRARLFAFLDPWNDPTGSGYQNAQALIALGSGGIWGKGLGNGTQKIAYLPEAPSDMIAAVIGEELGLLGILATALAFALFALIGFRIALRCRDPFGRYLVAGATCLVTGQALVNFGAVLGLLPLTGVPLPFISTGGSSLVVFLVIVGIMLNVASSSARPVAEARRPEASARPGRPRPARARHAFAPSEAGSRMAASHSTRGARARKRAAQ